MGDIPEIGSVTAWYGFEENGGTAYDSHSNFNLTEVGGTIPRGNGKIGYCRNFEKDDRRYLRGEGIVGVNSLGCNLYGLWIKPESIGTTQVILYANDCLKLRILSTGVLELQIYDPAHETWGAAQYDTPLIAGNWYYITVMLDYVSIFEYGVLALLQVNNGTAVATGSDIGMGGNLGSDALYVGANDSNNNHFDGKMDEFFALNRYYDIFNANELTWLYNSGNGRTYNDLKTGGYMAMF